MNIIYLIIGKFISHQLPLTKNISLKLNTFVDPRTNLGTLYQKGNGQDYVSA